ncbi:phage/plasmid primase, P4 family [Mesorhizobium sp. IMUNJ 23232]|uniref:phage/plasmid primase, P4 family n=1 Tax=Mesorhizobium sp. IMUNJ 23232 TaxID=3376064 RepID=UPI0037920AD6
MNIENGTFVQEAINNCRAEQAVEFLHKLAPDGPWVLWAKEADGPFLCCSRAYYPGDEAEVAAWIEAHAARNQYFHLNPYPDVRRDGARRFTKARKVDIPEVRYLHVDVDPRPIDPNSSDTQKADHLESERERIRLQLETQSPTFLIDSGGGYQALWRLEEPMVLDGSEASADRASAYNFALANQFEGDIAARDVSRVLRLPGTVNWPDAKKRAKGRKHALARLVHSNDQSFPIRHFEMAERVDAPPSIQPQASEAPKSGIAEQVWNIIRAGHDSKNPNRWPSRSEAVFYVCCELIRAGYDDAAIADVITNPRHGISEHVLEQGHPQAYAMRQAAQARARLDAEPPSLNSGDPLRSAREFIRRRRPTLMRYNHDWLAHDGAAYIDVEEGTIKSELYGFVAAAIEAAPDGSPRPFLPTKAKVANIMDALDACAHTPRDTYAPPCWLDGDGPRPSEIVACRNGLLHLPSGQLLPSTSRFFTRNALSFDYDATTAEPTHWLEFLASIWPGDAESVATLQEMFGYLLVPDTSLQKIFLLVGPPRSGKGTIGRVLMSLVGDRNACAPAINSLGNPFGLQPLIGKQVAIVSDMRLGRKTDHAALAENLLRISGEDMVTADRKYKEAWTGRLAARFVIITNILPTFADASGALANRFIPLVMTESFCGRENPNLSNQLLLELPGILNWAVAGWKRLKERGYFVPPPAAAEAMADLSDLASPVAAFVREECDLDPQGIVSKLELFDAWRKHGERRGQTHCGTLSTFSRDLLAAFPKEIKPAKPRQSGERVPSYQGIRLRSSPF